MIGNKAQLKGCQIVIFGGTGDLTHRKLMPAFYNLLLQKLLPDDFCVVTIGRRNENRAAYLESIYHSLQNNINGKFKEEIWQKLRKRVHYQRFDFRDEEGYRELKEILDKSDNIYNISNRIFYLAVAPEYFALIVDKLADYKMINNSDDFSSRLVIEKPFGYDLKSANLLNKNITKIFPERNIYRIDHYLGKEMLQNIMVIRFANAIFEPIWNNKYIDNIQIISSESYGVKDRGRYYDKAGALRDMVQNHMLQILALTAMEPPANMKTEAIRDEKVKVFKSLAEFDLNNLDKYVVRGQYSAGKIDGKDVVGYCNENKISPESTTETFVALKLFIDNLRWSGIPFYIKTGKRLPRKVTKVIVEFKSLFLPSYLRKIGLTPNLLVIKIQPEEGVYFQFNAKEPGSKGEIIPVKMGFCQNCQIGINSPEAYERLIYSVMNGDQTLFTRWDEVNYSWRFVDKIAEAWQEKKIKLSKYLAGSRGPKEADKLLIRDGRKWWDI